MPSLLADQIDDLVQETLEDLGRDELIQLAQEQPDYPTYTQIFKKERKTFSGGIGIRRTMMTRFSGAAKTVGLYEVDDVAVINLLKKLNIDWRHATTNWGYEHREMLMNTGEARINNIIKPRRAAAVGSLVELIEELMWSAPAVDNDLDPYGIPYWIVKNSSTGFNGGYPGSHTTIGGVNLTNVPNFKNYTAAYTNVTKADLIKKMRTAHRKVGFKTPVDIKGFRSFAERYRYYMNETTLSNLEDVGEAQNENLGRDIASMDGSIVFKRHPLIWVPQLDSDTSNPIYQINHDTFHTVALKGDWMRESGPIKSAKQHNVREVHIDVTFNTLCIDRRRNAVFYVA